MQVMASHEQGNQSHTALSKSLTLQPIIFAQAAALALFLSIDSGLLGAGDAGTDAGSLGAGGVGRGGRRITGPDRSFRT